jgi:hypothetical protein
VWLLGYGGLDGADLKFLLAFRRVHCRFGYSCYRAASIYEFFLLSVNQVSEAIEIVPISKPLQPLRSQTTQNQGITDVERD